MANLPGLDLTALLAEIEAEFPPPPEPERRGRGRPRKAGGATAADLDDRDWKMKCARAYVAKIAGGVGGNKGSHPTLYVAVTLIHGFALDRGDAKQIMEEWNATCDPPWSDSELDHKLDSAAAKEKPDNGRPRGHLIPRRVRPAPVPKLPPVLAKFDVTGLDGDAPPPAPPGAAAGDDPTSVAGGLDDPKEGGAVAAPPVDPLDPPVPDDDKETFSNFDPADDTSPHLTEKLDADRLRVFGDWPKAVDGLMFVQGRDYKPVFIKNHQQLFGWFDHKAWVRWTEGKDFINQCHYYEYLVNNVPRYESLELLPHWPPRPNTYYMHPEVEGKGGTLETLLDFFHGHEAVDRQFIKAFILTLFSGIDPGTRPVFLFTAADDDAGKGRGVGKSTLISLLAGVLVGGYVDILPKEDIGAVKTRLLSDRGFFQRVARIDNIKRLKFSWDGLEGLVTSPIVSGKKLYVGEGMRPNLITWAITLNGASMSKDMSERVCVTKLGRPPSSPGWLAAATEFVMSRKMDLLVDIRDRLLAPPPADFRAMTRWAAWEQAVLSKVVDPDAAQAAFVARQKAVDADEEDTDEVRAYIFDKIRQSGNGDPQTGCLRISSLTMARWLSEVTGENYATNRATSFLKGLAIKELKQFQTNNARGWIWTGTDAPFTAEPKRGQRL